VRCAARAVKQFDDLVADVVGPGSVDEPLVVPPGGTISLTLSVTADEAKQGMYEIPVEAGGASGVAKVTVRRPLMKVAMRVKSTDPRTLAKTIEIKNEGDGLADFGVSIALPNDKEVRLDPGAKHVNLWPNRTMEFVASPVLYLEFEKLSAELVCTAAGQTQKLTLDFARPAGSRLVGVRNATQERTDGKDWICTNKPNSCTAVPGASGNGPEKQETAPDPAADGKKFIEYLRKEYVKKSSNYKYTYEAKGGKNAEGQTLLDCSGFISRVLGEQGYVDPVTNDVEGGGCERMTKTLPKVTEAEAQPGDIIIWEYKGWRRVQGTTDADPSYTEIADDGHPDHCGFVSDVKDGKVISAIHNSNSGIHEAKLAEEASGIYKENAVPLKGPQMKMSEFVVGYYRPRKQPKEGEGCPAGGGCPPTAGEVEGGTGKPATSAPTGGAR
jgi:hypothetical protein